MCSSDWMSVAKVYVRTNKYHRNCFLMLEGEVMSLNAEWIVSLSNNNTTSSNKYNNNDDNKLTTATIALELSIIIATASTIKHGNSMHPENVYKNYMSSVP